MVRSAIVAANIKAIRKKLGLSQAQAGERIHVTQQTWAQYESGDYNLGVNTVEEIARALETSSLVLMGYGESLQGEHSNTHPKKKKTG